MGSKESKPRENAVDSSIPASTSSLSEAVTESCSPTDVITTSAGGHITSSSSANVVPPRLVSHSATLNTHSTSPSTPGTLLHNSAPPVSSVTSLTTTASASSNPPLTTTASASSNPPLTTTASASSNPPLTTTVSASSNPPTSSSINVAPDITVCDINALKLFMAVRKGSPVAKAFAAVFEVLSNRGNTSILQHCYNCMGQDAVQKQFNKKEIDKLSLNMLPDFDVTMLYKLLQRCCGLSTDSAFWVQPGDSVEHRLFLLKNQRNFFAHEAFQLSKCDLDSRLKIIRELIEELCDKTGVDPVSKVDYLTQLDNIHISSSLQAEHADRMIQLKAIKEDIQEDLLQQSIVELRDRYKKMRVLSPITWFVNDELLTITIDKVFTKLTMRNGRQSEIPVEKILVTQDDSGVVQSTVVITGIAGSGKTSLCRYLIYCWTEQNAEIEILENYQLLIFIQCRYVQSNGLAAFVKEDVLKNSLHLVPETEVIEMLHRFKPLFIIDGYDEADNCVQNLILEIHYKFPSNKILITSRPHVYSDLTAKLVHNHACSEFLSLKIKGFDQRCISEYARKLFSTLNQSGGCDAFIQYVDQRKKLQPIIELPLTLALLILLWIDDRSNIDEVSTESQIHVKIIEMMKKRLSKRLLENSRIRISPLEMENNVKPWLMNLGQIALEGIGKQKLYLDGNDMKFLESKCKNVVQQFDVEDAMSSILLCETSISLTSCEKIWSFIHTTQQEMMAAQFIVKEVKEGKRDFSECFPNAKFEQNEQMVNLLLFALELIPSSCLTEECGVFIAKHFPLYSVQNILFIGSALASVNNNEIIVSAFRMHLDTNTLPRPMPFECMRTITNLMERSIMSSQAEVVFSAPEDNFQNALRSLNNVGCKPILVLNTSWDDIIQSFIEFFKDDKKGLQAHFILKFGISHSEEVLKELISVWDWSQPLKFSGVRDIFAHTIFYKIMHLLGSNNIMSAILECSQNYKWSDIEKYCKNHHIPVEVKNTSNDLVVSLYRKP